MSSWKTAGAVGTFVLAFAVTSLNLAWSEDTKLPNLDVAAARAANDAPATPVTQDQLNAAAGDESVPACERHVPARFLGRSRIVHLKIL